MDELLSLGLVSQDVMKKASSEVDAAMNQAEKALGKKFASKILLTLSILTLQISSLKFLRSHCRIAISHVYRFVHAVHLKRFWKQLLISVQTNWNRVCGSWRRASVRCVLCAAKCLLGLKQRANGWSQPFSNPIPWTFQIFGQVSNVWKWARPALYEIFFAFKRIFVATAMHVLHCKKSLHCKTARFCWTPPDCLRKVVFGTAEMEAIMRRPLTKGYILTHFSCREPFNLQSAPLRTCSCPWRSDLICTQFYFILQELLKEADSLNPKTATTSSLLDSVKQQCDCDDRPFCFVSETLSHFVDFVQGNDLFLDPHRQSFALALPPFATVEWSCLLSGLQKPLHLLDWCFLYAECLS